jgi:PAS domain S-box-containing protein
MFMLALFGLIEFFSCENVHDSVPDRAEMTQDPLEYAENIIATVREPLVVLDAELRVISANRSFYDFFEVSQEETVGEPIHNLGSHQWDVPELKELLEQILPKQNSFSDFLVDTSFPSIGRKVMLLNARQVLNETGKPRFVLLAIEDITDRRKAEEERERLIAELQQALDEIKTLRGIIPICAYCKKIRDDQGYWNQLEQYIRDRSEAEFSHGICPDCDLEIRKKMSE